MTDRRHFFYENMYRTVSISVFSNIGLTFQIYHATMTLN